MPIIETRAEVLLGLARADDDGSKKLKYDQIVSTVEAAKTAPTLSGAVLCRNLMDHDSPTKSILPRFQHCVQRIVLNVRKLVTKQHLDGFNLKDIFGSLQGAGACAPLAL